MFSGFIFSSHIFQFGLLLFLTCFIVKMFSIKSKIHDFFGYYVLIVCATVIFVITSLSIYSGGSEITTEEYTFVEKFYKLEELEEPKELVNHYLIDGEISKDEYKEIINLYKKCINENNLNNIKNKIARY